MKFLHIYAMLMLSLGACTRQDPSNAKARAIWLAHQKVVEAATRGERTDVAVFGEAILFFEDVAGIEIPVDHSSEIDWFPTRETASALEPLNRWYKANGNRLYCDPDSGKVMVRP